jgi:sugar/nucleoside kinase (ribokinase family)
MTNRVSLRLIQLSGVIVDLVYRVEQVPAPGTEAIVHGATLAAGGGFNAMVAARRMGMAVDYGGTLGTGPFADLVAAALATEGIGLIRPRLAEMDQGCCTVLVDRDGERSFIASSGADGVVTDAGLAAIRPGPGDWVLLSGYALGYRRSRDALTRWLRRPPAGLRLVFDPCPLVASLLPEARDAALAAATWVTANAAEAAALTGLYDPAAAAVQLAGGRAGGALVRTGAEGCHLARPDGRVTHLPGHPVRAIDTNGAGDTHAGAFIAFLAAGQAPHEAARLANVCAALSTTKEGPSTAPHLSDVLAAAGRTGPEVRHA